MADGSQSTYDADLARQRAQAAAQSKVLAKASEDAAKSALEQILAQRQVIEQALSDAEAVRLATVQIRNAVRADLEAAQAVRAQVNLELQQTQQLKAQVAQALTNAQEILDAFAADQVAYDDAATQLGAATVAEAIAILAERLVAGPPPAEGGQLDFSDPNQSGLLPGL